MDKPPTLPTHLAMVARRLEVVGPSASSDTWLMTSYLTEAFIKTLAVCLIAGARKAAPDIARTLSYNVVRADGLGTWEQMIYEATAHAQSGYIDSELQTLVAWISKRRTQTDDSWAKEVSAAYGQILALLDLPDAEPPAKLTVRHILGQLVRIRNKTRAHGAVGSNFWASANPAYIAATNKLLEQCPACHWEWFHIHHRTDKDNVRAVKLAGAEPKHMPNKVVETLHTLLEGMHFRTHDRGKLFQCGDLLTCDLECTTFWLPNGGYTKTGAAEYLDYGSGKTYSVELPQYQQPPAPLPPSETEGGSSLDVFCNVWGNLPAKISGYVNRPTLERELQSRLRDRNHPIITLHGKGGIGKTSLALDAVHNLANDASPLFDHIIWCSSRDLELKPSGPTAVRRAVRDLESTCQMLGRVLGRSLDVPDLARILQNPLVTDSQGILFVFDNFETLDDPREMHQFLDTHTHIPNKVLITSRERAFKGDFPIEVGGLESEEARILLQIESERLGIESIVDGDRMDDIYEYTNGHAYVMRVLLGEIAKSSRWIPLKSIVPKRSDLLGAIFERSYNKLSVEGRWIFLLAGNWRSAVIDLALHVVAGMRDLDAERGIDECLRLSLLNRHDLGDGSFCYSCPELAQLFARKKKDSDPDRLLLEEDLSHLRDFGDLRPDAMTARSVSDIVQRLVSRCIQRLPLLAESDRHKYDAMLERIAELEPSAWMGLAAFRQQNKADSRAIDYAYQRAAEEMPYNSKVWLERAEYARTVGDENVRIASLLSAVDADSKNIDLMREVAFALCGFLDRHKHEIPLARRGVYLATLRGHMEAVAARLDATGLSRLAWLFLLEDDREGALKYANMGLAKDATNSYCLRIAERLDNF